MMSSTGWYLQDVISWTGLHKVLWTRDLVTFIYHDCLCHIVSEQFLHDSIYVLDTTF